MNNGKTIYGVAVTTALLGKTEEKEIVRYFDEYEDKDIQAVRELQPILLDFSLTNEQIMVKIKEVLGRYGINEKIE